jgi:hypothetical protein
MGRLVRVILLIGCGTALLSAQVSKEQGSVGQTPPTEQAAAPTKADASPKTQFPLDAFTDFSALMTGSRMGIGDEVHVYRSGALMRVEGPEGHGYFLTDLRTLETWGISADGCVHDARHPYFRTAPFPAAKPGTKVERVSAGEEVLDGHSCQIEDVTVSSSTPGAAPLKMKLWEAQDLQGFPIKIEFPAPGGKRNAAIRYRNVMLGPQDPTLFLRPKSCAKLPSKEEPTKPKGPTPTKKPSAAGPQK